MTDLRMRTALAQMNRLLEARLTTGTLQAALAEAHAHGGDLNAAVAELCRRVCRDGIVDQGGPVLELSVRDRSAIGDSLPTRVSRTALPDTGSAELPLACVHCRLPLTLELSRSGLLADAGAYVPASMSEDKYAYATLLYGDKIEYFLGALVLGTSLRNTNPSVDRLLLHTDDVPTSILRALEHFWTLRQVQYLEGSPKLYKNFSQSRFKAVFTKLQALTCTDYAKVMMLDLDMLVRGSLEEIFDLPTPAAMKRSSGREQPAHGGTFDANDIWRSHRDDMCSGINAGLMLLQPDLRIYERMVSEIRDSRHPEHLGTYGPEQDYLARFYTTFMTGAWTHVHARFNYQLMLPDDYVSAAHRGLDIERDVVVAHYSGPRVKPWELERDRPLDEAGVRRLLQDDSVRGCLEREYAPPRASGPGNKPPPPRGRVMDGVLVVDNGTSSTLPAAVQAVMWEWIQALRGCAECLLEEAGLDLLAVVREAPMRACAVR